jgi:hypothetical protein
MTDLRMIFRNATETGELNLVARNGNSMSHQIDTNIVELFRAVLCCFVDRLTYCAASVALELKSMNGKQGRIL